MFCFARFHDLASKAELRICAGHFIPVPVQVWNDNCGHGGIRLLVATAHSLKGHAELFGRDSVTVVWKLYKRRVRRPNVSLGAFDEHVTITQARLQLSDQSPGTFEGGTVVDIKIDRYPNDPFRFPDRYLSRNMTRSEHLETNALTLQRNRRRSHLVATGRNG